MKHKIICGHVIPVLETLSDEYVDTLLTSVPYWGLRDYGKDTATIWGGDERCKHDFSPSQTEHDNLRYRGATSDVGNEKNEEIHKGKENSSGAFCSKCGAWRGQLGLEPTPELYIGHLRMVFAEVKRVLKKTGTCWVNIGDSYASGKSRYNSSPHTLSGKGRDEPTSWDKPDLYKQGYQDKCMCMIPERFAFMMLDLGYILRNKIIWHKPNPMPSSVKDRFNTTYEMLYFFSKSRKYWFDLDAVREPWTDKRPADIRRAEEKHKGYQGKYGSGYNAEYRDKIPGQGIKGQPVGNPSSGKNPGDLWSINTQPFSEAHFAVFPEKLCEKPILAGCPAEVCKHCGMARVRITEQGEFIKTGGKRIKDTPAISEKAKKEGTGYHLKETIGWTDCQCEGKDKYEPSIILDPFGGSGTVSVEAEKLGRNSIYIDIKKDYCEMAIKRLKSLAEQTKLTGAASKIERTGF